MPHAAGIERLCCMVVMVPVLVYGKIAQLVLLEQALDAVRSERLSAKQLAHVTQQRFLEPTDLSRRTILQHVVEYPSVELVVVLYPRVTLSMSCEHYFTSVGIHEA